MEVNYAEIRAGLSTNPTRFNHAVEASILAIPCQLRNKTIMMVSPIAPKDVMWVIAQIDFVPTVASGAEACSLWDGYAKRLG